MGKKNNNIYPFGLLVDNIKKAKVFNQPFEPTGNWMHKYDILTLYKRTGTKVGELILERKNIDNEKYTLLAEYNKNITLLAEYKDNLDGDFYNTIKARFNCNSGKLGNVKQASFTSATVDENGSKMKWSKLSKTITISNNIMKITCNDKTTNKAIAGNHAFHWAMFENVQRLQGDANLELTFIDDFDKIKEGHSLRQFKEVQLDQQEKINVLGYEQRGEGIVPRFYWLDQFGRCLFVISGIEAYILNEEQKYE